MKKSVKITIGTVTAVIVASLGFYSYQMLGEKMDLPKVSLKVQEVKTSAGNTYWYVETPSSPMLSVSVLTNNKDDYDIGTRFYQNKDRTVLTLIEGGLTAGTKMMSAEALNTFMRRNLISINTYTDGLDIGVQATFLSIDADKGFSTLEDVIYNPLFDKKRLAVLKKQNDSRWLMATKSPEEVSMFIMDKIVTGRDDAKHLYNYNLDREKIAKIYNRLWLKKNLDIVVVTSLSKDKVSAYVDGLVKKMPTKKRRLTYKQDVKVNVVQKEVKVIFKKPQTYISWIGAVFEDTLDNKIKASLLNQIANQHLDNEIREEKGLVYYVYTYGEEMVEGKLVMKGETEVANDKVEELIGSLDKALNDIRNKDILNKETLRQAKVSVITKKIFGLTTNSRIASTFLDFKADGYTLNALKERQALIQAITLQDLQQFAKTYYQRKLTVYAGNPKKDGLKEYKNILEEANKK